MDLNKVLLIGRLGQKPILKNTENSIIVFSLAVNDLKKVNWIQCEAWNKTADLLLQFGEKGKQLAVVGRLSVDSWDKDGITQTRMKVVVESIQFLSQSNSENLTHTKENPF